MSDMFSYFSFSYNKWFCEFPKSVEPGSICYYFTHLPPPRYVLFEQRVFVGYSSKVFWICKIGGSENI